MSRLINAVCYAQSMLKESVKAECVGNHDHAIELAYAAIIMLERIDGLEINPETTESQ